jgi:ethanolamine utilization microcompartment shell protein EutS
MRAVTVLEGALTLGGVTVTGGRAAVIAAGAGDLALKAEGVHAVIASVA